MAAPEIVIEEGACRSCGASLRPSKRFCPECGAGTSDSTAPIGPRVVRGGIVAPPRTLWDDFKPLLRLFMLMLTVSLVAGWTGHVYDGPEVVSWHMALDAVIVCVFAVMYRTIVVPALAPRVPSLRTLLLVGGTTLIFGLAMEGAFGLLQELGLPLLRITEEMEQAGWPMWAMYTSVAIVPPVYEEVAFRGVFQGALTKIVGAHQALLIQAALFSAMHINPTIFATHFCMGLAFGWLRARTGSLYPGMFLHAAWNAWVVYGELGPAGSG